MGMMGDPNPTFLFKEACAEQMIRTGQWTKIGSLSGLFCITLCLALSFRPHWLFSRVVSSSPPPGPTVVCPHRLSLSCPLFWSPHPFGCYSITTCISRSEEPLTVLNPIPLGIYSHSPEGHTHGGATQVSYRDPHRLLSSLPRWVILLPISWSSKAFPFSASL